MQGALVQHFHGIRLQQSKNRATNSEQHCENPGTAGTANLRGWADPGGGLGLTLGLGLREGLGLARGLGLLEGLEGVEPARCNMGVQ